MFPKMLQVPQLPPSVVLYAKVQDEQAGIDVPTTVPVLEVTNPVRDAKTDAVDEDPFPNPDAVSVLPERVMLPVFTLMLYVLAAS